jgi:hypothetical protein
MTLRRLAGAFGYSTNQSYRAQARFRSTSHFYLTAVVKAFAPTQSRCAAAKGFLPFVVAAGWRILKGIAPQ